MKRSLYAVLLVGLAAAVPAAAQDNALGLYFSDSAFTAETASRTVAPGFLMPGYIVLTNPTGDLIDGYEVGITCTAADFAIPMTNLTFDTNEGTNTNQIISFAVPKPALAGGTILAMILFSTDSANVETISFGASSPSSLPGDLPVVDYRAGGVVACGQPFGTPIVAWLNAETVAAENSTWGDLKATFR